MIYYVSYYHVIHNRYITCYIGVFGLLQFQTQERCKSFLRKHKELNLVKISPVERNIVGWNKRLD